MTTLIIRFLNIIMAGMIAGTLFGIWIGYNPRTLSVTTYVEQQQSVIRAMNTLMPILGLITTILTLISAFLQKDNKTIFITLLIAAFFLIIGGLVTRFGNQPINSIVMTWNKGDVPGNWAALRDKWWMLHTIRTVTVFVAFCLIVWTGMRKV
ncbi:uncharacterized protein DUF1772 [Chitinophaga niastensis]|uniref:Uncharacterized protein DUF1772 n=1 Tax=Chitinophaga niastensis TaxID=536980 RepID=A0A2P8HJC7_CHINA|nr:DUF1772 domain-containing protein [Chitinophaga niastensis]PSL46305.1 uncharacterized protein DUF1772 [Chitinophaga niastensis]